MFSQTMKWNQSHSFQCLKFRVPAHTSTTISAARCTLSGAPRLCACHSIYACFYAFLVSSQWHIWFLIFLLLMITKHPGVMNSNLEFFVQLQYCLTQMSEPRLLSPLTTFSSCHICLRLSPQSPSGSSHFSNSCLWRCKPEPGMPESVTDS